RAGQQRPAARTIRASAALQLRIDGRLDEAAWATAPAAGDFVQQLPTSGAAATQRTEARVLVDGDAIYVGMRMYDTAPDSILAQLTRRDAGSTSDGARVFIDSYHDRRTAFVFGLNPRGVKDDFLRFDDGAGVDDGWDAVWDGAARVDSAGWVAEFRIPLSQLRFNPAAGGAWGINFRRYIARSDEIAFWSPIPPNSNAFVSLFGDLEGVGDARQGRRLEILPYVSSRLDHVPPAERGAFVSANEVGASVGADVKAGLPGGLTLTATLNPDFGQVEVDPADVNLSAFETFFAEQRPFFVEGSDIFRFGQLNTFNSYGQMEFFYSRRVGRQPQGGVDVDGITASHAPTATTILGAAKVSGKMGGWSVGVMDALTQREDARFRRADGSEGDYPVEPMTNYFVSRLRRDFGGGATVVGGMLTGVNRDLEGDAFDGWMRSSAYLAGVDGQHSWGDRAWTLSGYYAQSLVNGSEGALERTQRSSARYFQRPDADYLDLDPTRESLGGGVAGAALSHAGSWDASLTYQEVSPGFETNDLGFHTRADSRAFGTFVGRRSSRPSKLLRSHSFYAYSNHVWNFGGDRILDAYAMSANGTLHSLWNGGFTVGYRPAFVSDRLTRGGPLAAVPSEWRGSVDLSTDSRKRVSAGIFAEYVRNAEGESSRFLGVEVAARPTSSVQVRLNPELSLERSKDQYVDQIVDGDAEATFGTRYLFADVDRTTLSMNTRLDWTFSPNLSLQVFAQPYVSVGDFSNYKSLDRPESFSFTPVPGGARDGSAPFTVSYGEGKTAEIGARPQQLDFTALSLRGNAVLRWEYRPGSALFFVWQQERADETIDGSFDFSQDSRDIFGNRARNVFLIKATYWLNR
ncbi:MAG TPA: DUF5916 domain-containing protein, partial [Longimicrobium sp.]|nr:DUF5916 domain-containing protein [Longimicrobium sp.]